MHPNETKLRGSESKKSNLCKDKINTAGLVHVARQINPLADPGVTFRCGCQDVSAGVQQPPVVAVIGWSRVDESEGGGREDGNEGTCHKGGERVKKKRSGWRQSLAVSPSFKTGTFSKFNIPCGHEPSPTRPAIQSGFLSYQVDNSVPTGNKGKSSFYPVRQKAWQDYGPWDLNAWHKI